MKPPYSTIIVPESREQYYSTREFKFNTKVRGAKLKEDGLET